MCDAVAESAFRELRKHCCRVWCAVTALALGHHLVFCLMTGHASKLTVFEFTGRKQLVGFLVTGCAVLGRCFVTIDNILRHMCLVTFLAVSGGLFGEVRFMALGASRNFAVSVVARAAEERSMFALVVAQFDNLAGMAGHAGVGNVITKFDIQRCVGIRVAAVAGGQLVVRFPFVALAAERDDLPCCGGVPIMTILTSDLSLVLAPCRSDIGRRFAVTFGTVVIQ